MYELVVLIFITSIKKFIRFTLLDSVRPPRTEHARHYRQFIYFWGALSHIYICFVVVAALKKTRVEFQIILWHRARINNSGIKTFYTNSIDRWRNVLRVPRKCIGFSLLATADFLRFCLLIHFLLANKFNVNLHNSLGSCWRRRRRWGGHMTSVKSTEVVHIFDYSCG